MVVKMGPILRRAGLDMRKRTTKVLKTSKIRGAQINRLWRYT
jgi:hypothetical protein